MRLAATIQLHAGGEGSGCNPEAGKCGRTAEERTGKEGRALDRARKDPRQTSLYGPEHEKELQHKALDWNTLREGVAHGAKFVHNGMTIERQASEHSKASHVTQRETWKIDGKPVTKAELVRRLVLKK